jgi:hypothetical protein
MVAPLMRSSTRAFGAALPRTCPMIGWVFQVIVGTAMSLVNT